MERRSHHTRILKTEGVRQFPELSTLDIRLARAPESLAVIDLDRCLSSKDLTNVVRQELEAGSGCRDLQEITLSREGGIPIVGEVMSLPVRSKGDADGWRFVLQRLQATGVESVHLVGRVDLARAC